MPCWRSAKGIVDATADLACAFKPQIAYFAAAAPKTNCRISSPISTSGTRRCRWCSTYRRGDIGATAQQYAREGVTGADAT